MPGFAWLGTKLITPSLLIAYIWIWAGFSMVVIAAGLSAMPRDVLEAARTDGASEWQVFRRVTVPLLAPVLSVVFITMIINVLKVFDLVITLAPGSSQNAANVIALAMWRTVLRRCQRLRHRLGDRGLPVRARDPGAAAQHQALQERELMAEVAVPAPKLSERDTVAAKAMRFTMKTPVHIVLAFLAVLWVIPTLGIFLTSILPAQAFTVKGWWQIFSKPSLATWENYRMVLHNSSITHALWTTVQIAVGNTILVVGVAALAGYAFAWLDFPGRDWIFLAVIALLVVPLQMALIPMFTLYNKAGLYDTVLGIILFHVAFGLPFAIFLLRNFFAGIPKDILESARIDGASEIRIFVRLILPLGLPAIASLAIFQFLWTWNDLIVALTFGQNVQPITVAIYSNLRQFGANIDIIAPASFISVVVPLTVFFAFQRYFVQGLLAGSVK